jgi:peptide/nickel transport system substrate-binding protein
MEQKGLSRRSFLQVMAGSAAAAITASVGPLSALAAQEMTYNEAPMLADLVASGDLPSVEERIPVNPRVITPINEIGEYGGTWRRAFKGISDRWGPTKLNEEMAIEWDMPDADTVNLVPNFVSEWTQNEDATEFTFTLREGLKWSDGDDFTTEDVQFWYDNMYLGELQGKSDYLTPGGVDMELEVVDVLTWTVRFADPSPLLPINIAKNTGGPPGGPTMAVPSHYLRQYIPDMTEDQALIDDALERTGRTTWQELFGDGGNMQGPIAFWFQNPELPVINAWKAANSPLQDPYQMERNPYYHAVDTEGNQLPYIDGITHDLFEDNAVFDLWIAQGRIDMHMRHVNAANFTFYKENEEDGDYTVLLWRRAETNALHPNINNPNPTLAQLFDTAEFREALSVAINRVEINELVFSGLFEPRQASPVSGSPNYDPEFETRWTEYDPDRANALLDGLGLTERDGNGFRIGPDGETVTFRILHRFQTGTPEADEMQLVQDYWRAVGLNVSQDVVERSLYEERVANGQVDVGVWAADRNSVVMADAGRYLGTIDDGPWAPLYGHWYDTASTDLAEEPPEDHPIREIWALWEQTKVEPDEATRNALFQQLLDIHKEHPYMIGTVGEAPQPVIVSNRFGNVPNGYINDDTLRSPGGPNPCQFSIRAE